MEALIFRGFRHFPAQLPTKLSTVAGDVWRSGHRAFPGIPQWQLRSVAQGRELRVPSGHNRASPPGLAGTPSHAKNTAKRTRLFSIIQAAGWPIWPLILCSIVALTLIIERLSSLRAARVAPPKLLEEVVSVTRAHLPAADVVNKLADNSILGNVLAHGLRVVIADPRITEEVLRNTFENAGRAAVHKMERFMNTLGTIASAAPLLGLLGTVIGMIEIFGSQAPSGGTGPAIGRTHPPIPAPRISTALYNTAFGLIVAIPALIFWRYFRARVDAYLLTLELAAEQFVHHMLQLRQIMR